jgi:glycosyltransferase involved in cell wall biosynthesis
MVSSAYSDAEIGDHIGREAYSYHFVYKAFASLLERWGQTSEVTRPESRLDFALMQARENRLDPIHLSFLPLHLTYLTGQAPNIVFPFWEFPDIPDRSFGHNLRNNWAHVAQHLSLILTACRFTRDAFLRAGVKTPIRVVPVPIAPEYFAVPAWERGQQVSIDCPAYVFPQPEPAPPPFSSVWVPAARGRLGARARAKLVYKSQIKPRIPARLDRYLTLGARLLAAGGTAQAPVERVPFVQSDRLDLSGVVFTTIFNPYDPRKNWQDLLSAFILGLGNRPDATLVLKLVVCPQLAAQAVNGLMHYYHRLGVKHRCKVVLLTHFLSEKQMVELARASTFYCNTARAEGSCLPLQNFMAGRRPGITANHTAITDYFNGELGLQVDSHPEPASWPHDPEQRLNTSWHRVVWQSLHDQLRAGYEMASSNCEDFQGLALRSHERMIEYASAERVWPRLSAALSLVGRSERSTAGGIPGLVRKAS